MPCLLFAPGLLRCAALGRPRTPRPARARLCCAAAGAARGDLLKGVAPDNRIAVSRALDQAERAAAQWATAHSDFFPPPAAAEALACIARLSGVAAVPWGGYAQVRGPGRARPRSAPKAPPLLPLRRRRSPAPAPQGLPAAGSQAVWRLRSACST